MAECIEREKTVELLRSLGNRGYRKEKGTIQDASKMISYPEYTPTAIGAIVASVGNQITFARAQTTAPTAARRWTEVTTLRLIDADLLEDQFGISDEDILAKEEIRYAPTVDAVPVVRCKDCIYTRKLYGRLVCKYGTCSGCILREDFFCANGERKEDA